VARKPRGPVRKCEQVTTAENPATRQAPTVERRLRRQIS
jgi:hypothetical protein